MIAYYYHVRIIRHGDLGGYLVAGPVWHKCLEVGFQRQAPGPAAFDFYWRFRTRGHHAGLTFFVELFGWLFEFNLHDHRHWDYANNCWQRHE